MLIDSLSLLNIHVQVDVHVALADNDLWYVLYVGILQEAFSADSYLVLPIDSLGTSYYAMVAGPSNKPNMLAVAATEDMTTVTITLPPEAADGKSLIIPLYYNCKSLSHSLRVC